MLRTRYRWRPVRAWLGVMFYTCVTLLGVAMGGLGGPARARPSSTDGPTTLANAFAAPVPAWIILTMLFAVALCMISERGQWRPWERVGYLFLAWMAAGFLVIPILLLLLVLPVSVPRGPVIPVFLSALTIVVWSMRKSRWFVTVKQSPADHR